MAILPTINDRDQYKSLFKDNSAWEPAIHYLVKEYNLSGEIMRGALGSHIVYRVGECWIKLMAPLFAKDMPFEISGLRAVDGKLSVKTPKIIAEGNLEGWTFVILSHIKSEPIRHVWQNLSADQKMQLANQIAQIVKEIGMCKTDPIIKNRFEWNQFIIDQYENWETHQKRKELPEQWLKEVPRFLHSFNIEEFKCVNPIFIHADLTFDHFLVVPGQTPRISGIIDMADCQEGHFEYELVAPCTFIFKGQRDLLRQFLIGCGFKLSDLNERFSEKLLAWSILHRYFSLISFFQKEMSETLIGDFNALAKKVFPL